MNEQSGSFKLVRSRLLCFNWSIDSIIPHLFNFYNILTQAQQDLRFKLSWQLEKKRLQSVAVDADTCTIADGGLYIISE